MYCSPKLSIETSSVSCLLLSRKFDSPWGRIFRFLLCENAECLFVSFSSSELVAAIDIGENSTKLDWPRTSDEVGGGESKTEFSNWQTFTRRKLKMIIRYYKLKQKKVLTYNCEIIFISKLDSAEVRPKEFNQDQIIFFVTYIN